MKRNYKVKFQRLVFTNRWKQIGSIRYWGDFTLIGICKFVFSHTQYEWRLCFLGFEVRIWMEKINQKKCTKSK